MKIKETTKVQWFEIFAILIGAIMIYRIDDIAALLRIVALGIGYLVMSKAFETYGVYSGAKHYDEVGHKYYD